MIELRQVVTDLAKRCGYPRSRHQKALAEFDLETTKVFADREELQSGEALRNDVWAYVSTVLLGHLTIWRFPSPPMDRLRGGPRNAFQRLWFRSGCLDRGTSSEARWELVNALSEDAMVQIIERPQIAANPVLALEIAEGWLRCAEKVGKAKMEPIMRDTVRELRLLSTFRSLSVLSADALAVEIDGAFEIAKQNLGIKNRFWS